MATQGAAKQLLFSLHLSARNFIGTTFFHLQPFFATSPVQKVVALDEHIIIPSFFLLKILIKMPFEKTNTYNRQVYEQVHCLEKKTLKNKFDNQMLTIRIRGGGRVGGRENNWPTD